MSSSKKRDEQAKQLRRRAEKLIPQKITRSRQNLDNLCPEEAKSLLHELLVHQIELEMQNEELSNTRKELEISRARYFDLFNLAPVGYVTLSENGLILESNLAAANLLGIPVNELQNQDFTHYIFPDDQDIFYLHRQKVYTTGVSQECELRMNRNEKKSDVTVFWARLESLVAKPVKTGKNTPSNNGLDSRIVISDITENRKKTEQLHQAQKMETIGLLAGGVAHDYNNKLAVIIGYADLALNKEISPQTSKVYFEEILTAAQHSAAITRQLLTFARKQRIEPVVIDLNHSIESIFKMLRQVVGEEIMLAWRPDPELYAVLMDPVQIDQILLNLCLNAKASIDGRGQVIVETKNAIFDAAFSKNDAKNMAGKYILLEVSDTGCGMTNEVVSKIFEPFFTTREVGKGTGLGLSTVEGIVKQNKGFIKVVSKPGAGTTFKIYLPAYKATMSDKQLKKYEDLQSGHGKTVLVVENETALLPMIRIILEKLGFKVLTAYSADAAIEIADNQKSALELLITDVIMPKMTGCELLEIIKKKNPDIKALFMSGHSENVLHNRGFKGNNLNFLQKPFSMNALAQKIEKLFITS